MTAETHLPKPALKLIDFLQGAGARDLDDAELDAELGTRLARLGIPVDRLTLHLPTLHPRIFRRVVAWAPGEPVEIRDRGAGSTEIDAFHAEALAAAVAAGGSVEIAINPAAPPSWLDCDLFRNRGLAVFVLVPLAGASGPASVIGFATKRRQGFSDAAHAVLDGIAPALVPVMERRAARRSAA